MSQDQEKAGDSLALVEISSVARGLRCVDALVKRSQVRMHEANLVEPGKFLILFSGGVGEVEESFSAAVDLGGDLVVDRLLLPLVHRGVIEGLRGRVVIDDPDTVGVVEGRHVASVLEAADRSLKDAAVGLCGLRVTGGLGGRAYYVVFGLQHDVEAALDAGRRVLERRATLHAIERIARPHPEFLAWLLRPTPFTPTGL
jgi:microcompartment protein CcmL/EutN